MSDEAFQLRACRHYTGGADAEARAALQVLRNSVTTDVAEP